MKRSIPLIKFLTNKKIGKLFIEVEKDPNRNLSTLAFATHYQLPNLSKDIWFLEKYGFIRVKQKGRNKFIELDWKMTVFNLVYSPEYPHGFLSFVDSIFPTSTIESKHGLVLEIWKKHSNTIAKMFRKFLTTRDFEDYSFYNTWAEFVNELALYKGALKMGPKWLKKLITQKDVEYFARGLLSIGHSPSEIENLLMTFKKIQNLTKEEKQFILDFLDIEKDLEK